MNGKIIWGMLVLLVGVVLLLEALGVITGSIWKYFWALFLILIGLSMLFPRRFE